MKLQAQIFSGELTVKLGRAQSKIDKSTLILETDLPTCTPLLGPLLHQDDPNPSDLDNEEVKIDQQ
jgi:hypothetical protein